MSGDQDNIAPIMTKGEIYYSLVIMLMESQLQH